MHSTLPLFKENTDPGEKNKAPPTATDMWKLATKTQNLAFWIFLCGFLLNVIGFFSPYWFNIAYTGYGHSQGLWRWCILWPIFPQCTKMNVQQEWFKYLQALEFLGFVLSVISLLLISVFRFTTILKTKWVASLTIWSCFLASFLEMIGLGIILIWLFFVDKSLFTVGGYSMSIFTKDHISWSFFLTGFGASMYIVTGLLMIQTRRAL